MTFARRACFSQQLLSFSLSLCPSLDIRNSRNAPFFCTLVPRQLFFVAPRSERDVEKFKIARGFFYAHVSPSPHSSVTLLTFSPFPFPEEDPLESPAPKLHPTAAAAVALLTPDCHSMTRLSRPLASASVILGTVSALAILVGAEGTQDYTRALATSSDGEVLPCRR